MDRNKVKDGTVIVTRVALRKESVDRNFRNRAESALYRVALRKESVDRNDDTEVGGGGRLSLSARRAWIEMFCYCSFGVSGVGRSPQGERG